jgi:hypothetical protein
MADAEASTSTAGPKYAKTAADVQKKCVLPRACPAYAGGLAHRQLDKLLANPTKPAYIPEAPQAKQLRAPRDMMRNVMGSSAGAGSGEFHVYKQARRREYERLKLLEEEGKTEAEARAFEQRRVELETANATRAGKNKAKRDKKKAKRKAAGEAKGEAGSAGSEDDEDEATTEGAAPAAAKRAKMAASGVALAFRDRGAEEEAPSDMTVPAAPSRPGVVVVEED